MKPDKIIITLIVTAFFISATHQAVAQSGQSVKNGKMARSKSGSKNSRESTAKNSKRKKITKANSKSNKKVAGKLTAEKENQDIQNEIRALEMQASSGYVAQSKKSIPTQQPTISAQQSTSVIATELKQVAPSEATSPFSGVVNFTYGNDTDIDPDKTDVGSNFVAVEPKVSYKNSGWAASAGATLRDYADQDKSNMFKQTEAKADVSYTFDINAIANSETKIAVLYHDERWPDYLNGPDLNGVDHGMSIRYAETTLSEKLGFKLGQLFNLEVGGSYAHRDALSPYSNFAHDIFKEKRFERDYDEVAGFGKVTLSASEYVDFSLSPLVKQTKYTEREGRLPSGHFAELNQRTPLYELITSELSFDTALKYKTSNITPKFLIGQVSDEALGAEDQSYYGYGVTATLVVYEPLKLTIAPSAMYKKIKYDNWTSDGLDSFSFPVAIENGEKRLEDELITGVTASIMATKNFGVSLAYNMIKETTNLKNDSSENYRQEIVSSTLIFTF